MTIPDYLGDDISIEIPIEGNVKNTTSKSKEKSIGLIKKKSKRSYKMLYIQMEYSEGKTLKEISSEIDISNSKDIKNFTAQMIDALYYLHSKRLIHRDLKPANVFLDKEGNIKLGDFGLARSLKKQSSAFHYKSFVMDESKDIKMSQNIGTPFYMAPEQKHSDQYDSKVDIYSLGLILLELLLPAPKTKMEKIKVKLSCRNTVDFAMHFYLYELDFVWSF